MPSMLATGWSRQQKNSFYGWLSSTTKTGAWLRGDSTKDTAAQYMQELE